MDFRDDIFSELIQHIQDKNIVKVKNLIFHQHHEPVIAEHAWDLVTYVIQSFGSETKEQANGNLTHYESILERIVSKGKPKEMLLALLEHIHLVKSDDFFGIVLTQLQKVLADIPGKRGKSLDWTLSTLRDRISTLPLPQEYCFETEEENKLLDLDPAVDSIVGTLNNYLFFMDPFIKEVGISHIKKNQITFMERIYIQREILSYYLMDLFGHPLAYLDLSHSNGSAKSSVRVIGERIVKYLSQLSSNLFTLYAQSEDRCEKCIFLKSKQDSGEEVETNKDEKFFSELCVATLAYLYFAENVNSANFPSVYRNRHLFEMHLKSILKLLSYQAQFLIVKGIKLAQVMISRLQEEELTSSDLDMTELFHLFRALINTMIICPVKSVRGLALKVFTSYLKTFDLAARYMVYFRLLNIEKHSGVRGLLIDLYRTDLHSCIKSRHYTNPFSDGVNLVSFLECACVLIENEKSDILEESDGILAALNLLRYVFMKSKSCNLFKEESVEILEISKKFIDDLRLGINMSRAHYNLQLKQTQENKCNLEGNAVPDSFNLGASKLPPEQEIEMLKSALVRFDLIESVVVRLEEHFED